MKKISKFLPVLILVLDIIIIVGGLNKPGFPHRGLTCLAITSCLPGQSVVLFLSY